jgi:hypothetical protein
MEPNRIDSVVSDLDRLRTDQRTHSEIARIAESRLIEINRERDYLADNRHTVAFLGRIGAGKSSALATLAGLFTGERPESKKEIQRRSILAVGAGGTTVCEVRIRASSERLNAPGKAGIEIDPLSTGGMRRELELFAEEEWRKRTEDMPAEIRTEERTPREIGRALRNMIEMPLKPAAEPGGPPTDPLDDAFAEAANFEEFHSRLLVALDVEARTETTWEWADFETAKSHMRTLFAKLNHGREPTAALPRRITVWVPKPLAGVDGSELSLELVDTRGLDGEMAGRHDLHETLRDRRAVYVACTAFPDAPDDTTKALLRAISSNAEFRPALARLSIVMLDHGQAEDVSGAEGDRMFGQSLKVEQASRVLRNQGLAAGSAGARPVAFDACEDDPGLLANQIEQLVYSVRQAARDKLNDLVAEAERFLSNLEEETVAKTRDAIDRRLRVAGQANKPLGIPFDDPIGGLTELIRVWPHASQIYAMSRRQGHYENFDAFAAAREGAVRACEEWLRPLTDSLKDAVRQMEIDDTYSSAKDHLMYCERLIATQLQQKITEVADEVQSEFQRVSLADPHVWTQSEREWGQGKGFKERVRAHLTSWSLRHRGDFQGRSGMIALPLRVLDPPESAE